MFLRSCEVSADGRRLNICEILHLLGHSFTRSETVCKICSHTSLTSLKHNVWKLTGVIGVKLHFHLCANLIIIPYGIQQLLCKLTHCSFVTPHVNIDLDQHWLRGWHQTITWTSVDLSSVRSSDNHLRVISQEIPQPWITKIGLKITYLKFKENLPEANELMPLESVSGIFHLT